TGKTTMARALLNRLGESVDTALLFNPILSTWELLSAINDDFGQTVSSPSHKDQLEALNRFLLARFQEGRNALVVIDEAQNLSIEALEMIRLLSNLETPTEKLLQILLIGQPELDEKLARYELRQLNQRIILRSRLKPIGPEDISSYVLFRLGCAGANVDKISFEAAAFRRIYQSSNGLPRLINTLCDRVLICAFVEETRVITESIVRSAERDLTPEERSEKPGWKRFRRLSFFSLRG
ncbi:MAG: AAA family ATPase, partial [Deltaproteobacteria bacterium]|nr:AAA family ATPase [Deltaproteobacteria bacterium]